MKSLYDYLHYGIKESLDKIYDAPANFQKVLEQHLSILQAIRERNPDAACEAMRQHITFLMEFSEPGEVSHTGAH
jgi:DNA-binding FadR family transcriptional regulator